MSMHIVMTSSAHMPGRCKGTYANVAVVQLNQAYTAQGLRPKMISERARGILRIVRHWGPQNFGSTERCAYRRALAEAQSLCDRLNNVADMAEGELLISTGSA